MRVVSDLRNAMRALRSRPGYVAIAVVTLALGIGVTTAIFSVVDALMLRPLPYPNPDHVVRLQTRVTSPNEESISSRFSDNQWRALQERRELFDGVETYIFGQHVMTSGVEPQTVSVAQLSGGMLPMLGVFPQLGRPLTAAEATAGSERVLLLSDRLWREQFAGDPQIVGKRIELDDVSYEIVGVMPATFRFPWEGVRAWRPLVRTPPRPGARPTTYELVARVTTGLRLDQAQRDLQALAPALHEAGILSRDRVPQFDAIRTINTSERRPLWVLLGAVGLVLMIGCANVTNLGLANASWRRRELAVCTALGASRGRLVRQLLIETLILCLIGGVAGTWFAQTAVVLFAPLMPRELTFLSAHAIEVDGRVLFFAVALSISCAVLAGLVPALRGSRADVAETLKSSGRSQTASAAERRWLNGLAIAQCALAIMLLAGAGLLIRSFLKLQAVDPGFDTENLLVVSLPLTQSAAARYPDAVSKLAFAERLIQEVRTVPGVQLITLAGGTPPLGGGFREADVETDASRGATIGVLVPFTAVAPDYFRVMGIRMLAGRIFDAGEPPTTVVIDEVFAKRFWGSAQAAVGRRFRMGVDEEWHTVVGVAADVKQMGLDDKLGEGLEFYYAFDRGGRGYGGLYELVIRTNVPPASLVAAIKERVWRVDSKLPIYQSDDMRTMLAASIAKPRFFVLTMLIFAAVAATVAAVGIYAVFAYVVAQRTLEMGIRLALGATSNQIVRLILREGVVLAGAGAVFGLAGAWFTSRVLTTLLFQTPPTDPLALAGGALCLVALALVACYVPARRARRVDPLAMLKVE